MKKIKFHCIELIQSIQNAKNEILLLQGKATYVRLYICDTGQPVSNITASISLQYQYHDKENIISHHTQIVHSISALRTASNQPSTDLLVQRLDWDRSLNFLLPDDFFDRLQGQSIVAQDVDVELSIVSLQTDFTTVEFEHFCLTDCDKRIFKFVKPLEMHYRAVAYRHADPEDDSFGQPSNGQLDVVPDFIKAAFPVSNLHASRVTIDVPRRFNRLKRSANRGNRNEERVDRVFTLMFQHLLAIRNQDTSIGNSANAAKPMVNPGNWSKNTLYLGIIDDQSGRLGGAAMDSPQHPTPHHVAFAETESEGVLGAHELAHTLGRLHPGIPDRKIHGKWEGQTDQYHGNSSRREIHNRGYLSLELADSNEIYLGLDTRSDKHRPQVLPYNEYFDLMTYRSPQWVSNHTYCGLYHRLRDINSPPETTTTQPTKDNDSQYWTVIGEYNFRTLTGKINYVLPSVFNTNFDDENKPSNGAQYQLTITPEMVEAQSETDMTNAPQAIPQPVDTRKPTSDANPYLGVFQHTIKSKGNMPPEKLVLRLSHKNNPGNGTLLDVYEFGVFKEHIQNYIRNNFTSPIQRRIAGTSISTNDSNLFAKVGLRYKVDEAAYYLFFDIKDAIVGLSQQGVPITITIQFKRKSHEEAQIGSKGAPNKWETVTVTRRLSEETWVSPDFLGQLQNYQPLQPSRNISEKEDISSMDGSDGRFKVDCRVLVTASHFLIGSFELKDGQLNTEQPNEADNLLMEWKWLCDWEPECTGPAIHTFGNTGVNGDGYYAPIFLKNECADTENERKKSMEYADITNRQYYRPNIDPYSIPDKYKRRDSLRKNPCTVKPNTPREGSSEVE